MELSPERLGLMSPGRGEEEEDAPIEGMPAPIIPGWPPPPCDGVPTPPAGGAVPVNVLPDPG